MIDLLKLIDVLAALVCVGIANIFIVSAFLIHNLIKLVAKVIK